MQPEPDLSEYHFSGTKEAGMILVLPMSLIGKVLALVLLLRAEITHGEFLAGGTRCPI